MSEQGEAQGGLGGWMARAFAATKHHVELELHRLRVQDADKRRRRELEETARRNRAARRAQEAAEERARVLDDNERRIRAFYDDRLNVEIWQSPNFKYEDRVPEAGGWVKVKFEITFSLSRALSSMPANEVEWLRYLGLFRNYDLIDGQLASEIRVAILYNDGGGTIDVQHSSWSRGYGTKFGLKGPNDGVAHVLGRSGCDRKLAAVSKLFQAFSLLENEHPDFPVVKEFRMRVMGGEGWLSEHQLAGTVYSTKGEGLFLGLTEDGQRISFNGEGSLVTIAPSGSGKTQCHVFPNLLSYKGPAIVLDVKGECWEQTSAWRAKNVGEKVIRFSPLDAAKSARFNPLQCIKADFDTVWEECRIISHMLIVPKSEREPIWEDRARDLVQGVLAWLVMYCKPEERTMGTVMRTVSMAQDCWEPFMRAAESAKKLPPLQDLHSVITEEWRDIKYRNSVFDSARQHLSVWQGPQIKRVTEVCDWMPQVLMDGSRATIYICVGPREIESYAPVLRVFLTVHLNEMMRTLPPRERETVLFMLDELPRLGRMEPVQTALEVGRQYGIKLWMFGQNVGQFTTAYEDGLGLLGNCAVRLYMNPSMQDGVAARLAEELGYARGILDNDRQLKVEPAVLAGPEYADLQLALARGTLPLKLKKSFAHNNPEFSGRMGLKIEH